MWCGICMSRNSTVQRAKWKPAAWRVTRKSTWNGTLMKTVSRLAIIFFLLTVSCSLPSNRYHSEYAQHRPSIQRILIMPPEINVFTAPRDSRPIRQETPSRQAGRSAHDAVIRTLSNRGFMVRTADHRLLETREAASLRSLYRSVHRSIRLHAYGPQVFPAKTKEFDYAVGPVSRLLEASRADALLLVMGKQTLFNETSSTWISMAVVEPQGNIIWYGIKGDRSPKHEHLQADIVNLAREALQPFLDGAP